MAKMISYPTDPTQMERIVEAGSPEARELDAARVCRSCGLRGGAHEAGCRSIEAEARAHLQAACDHRRDYGVTQTTGDPLGPPCCGRCGKNLEPTALEPTAVTASVVLPYVDISRSTNRPPGLAFKPERVSIAPATDGVDASGWMINDIIIGNISQFRHVGQRERIARSLRVAAERLELAPAHRQQLRNQSNRMLGIRAGGGMDFEI